MNPASEALHGMDVGPLAVASYRGQTLPHPKRQDRIIELVYREGRFRLCAYIIAALPVVYAYERVAVWMWQVMP